VDIENNQFFSSVYRQEHRSFGNITRFPLPCCIWSYQFILKPFGRKLESWAVASSKHNLGNYHPLSSLNSFSYHCCHWLSPLLTIKKLCSCSHFPRTNENESESNDFELYRGINLGWMLVIEYNLIGQN